MAETPAQRVRIVGGDGEGCLTLMLVLLLWWTGCGVGQTNRRLERIEKLLTPPPAAADSAAAPTPEPRP